MRNGKIYVDLTVDEIDAILLSLKMKLHDVKELLNDHKYIKFYENNLTSIGNLSNLIDKFKKSKKELTDISEQYENSFKQSTVAVNRIADTE